MGMLPQGEQQVAERLTPEQLNKPIPETTVAGWKEVEIDESSPHFTERLVPVGPFSEFSDCDAWGVYFGERGKTGDRRMNFLCKPVNRETSLLTHFVREDVLNRLKVAQKMLPAHHYFIFYDNFRPLDVQQALFDAQLEVLREQHPDWNQAKLEEETQTYVSIPAPNPEKGTKHPSPHSTGGVVDLSIIRMEPEGDRRLRELEMNKLAGKLDYPISEDEATQRQEVIDWIETQNFSEPEKQKVMDGWLKEYRYFHEKQKIFKEFSRDLNMGTDFDYFGPEAATRYLETKGNLSESEEIAQRNRRMLYNIMTAVGFSNYEEEWWHYSIGDNMWAKATGQEKAYYGGFPELPEYCEEIEKARQGVYTQEIADFEAWEDELFTGQEPIDPRAIKE